LNTLLGISTIFSLLFLAFCIPINLAILWVYKKRVKGQQSTVGRGPSVQLRTNAAANASRSDLIERRLLFFAVITSFGHALISCLLVSQIVIDLRNKLYFFTFYFHKF
jgi:hypothetical protein